MFLSSAVYILGGCVSLVTRVSKLTEKSRRWWNKYFHSQLHFENVFSTTGSFGSDRLAVSNKLKMAG